MLVGGVRVLAVALLAYEKHEFSHRFRLLSSECEVKCRALVHLALGPHAASVAVGDPLDRRQPDPGAGEFDNPVQALERAKEFIGILHVESSSLVAHTACRLLPVLQ